MSVSPTSNHYQYAQTRDAILRDLPEEFERAGCELPKVSAELLDETDQILKRLRAKKQIKAHGAVSCKYELVEPSFSVVG